MQSDDRDDLEQYLATLPTVEDVQKDPSLVAEVKADLKSEGKKFENPFDKQHVKNFKADRKLRKKYANRLYYFIVFWSAFVVIVVMLQGFNLGFKLADSALIALLTSTMVSVLGLMLTILTGLFPSTKR